MDLQYILEDKYILERVAERYRWIMCHKYLDKDRYTWNQRKPIAVHSRCSIRTLCDIPFRYHRDLQ